MAVAVWTNSIIPPKQGDQDCACCKLSNCKADKTDHYNLNQLVVTGEFRFSVTVCLCKEGYMLQQGLL